MRVVTATLWGLFALVALVWTGAAAAVAQLVRWSAENIAAAGPAAAGVQAQQLPMPPWLGSWLDAATWAAVQDSVGATLAAAAAALPWLGTAMGWLVPAVWLGWGLGLLALAGLTLLGVWAARRAGRGGGPGSRGPQGPLPA